MINGSNAFNNAVDAGGYPYIVRILYNGNVVDCVVSGCTIHKGSTGGDSFNVGSVFVPYVELEVTGLITPLSNKEIRLDVGVLLNESDIEWITIGYFTVTKVSGSVVKTNLTAVGRIIGVLSRITVDTQTPITCSVLISAIQETVRNAGYANFTINTNNITLPTHSFELNSLSATAQTYLGILSGVIGGYTTEDNSGNVVIFKYNLNNTFDYDGSRMTVHPVFGEDDFELSDIKVIQREEYAISEEEIEPEISYTSGDNYEWVVLNPYIASQELFDDFCVNCLGLNYRPATVELTYGDPRLEAIDVLSITDSVGDSYIVPCMNLVHNLTGGLTTQIIAPYKEEQESDDADAATGPITQQLNQIAVNIMSIAANADIAKQGAKDAQESADKAQQSADDAAGAAGRAIGLANNAQDSANTAQTAANSATTSANVALNHLDIVQDVVGILDLVTKNGTYSVTADVEIVLDKWYFTRSGSNVVGYFLTEDSEIVDGKIYYTRTGSGTDIDPYVYTVVDEPDLEYLSTYYEYINDPYTYQVAVNPEAVYHLTDDTEIEADKTYYTRTGTGGVIYTKAVEFVEGQTYYTRSGSGTAQDPYVYTEVAEPVIEDLDLYYIAVDDPYVYTAVVEPVVSELSTYYEKYYELTSINEAIQNYISSHLVLTDSGLFLQQDKSDSKLQLSTDGVVLYGADGHVVAKYGTETVIGDDSGFHIKMGVNDQSGELGFYQGDYEVAYITDNTLFINQTVVVDEMDVGTPDTGGQWAWKVHRVNNQNNLYLKWMG